LAWHASVSKFLSPLQFSRDSAIDEETPIALFAARTQQDIGVLRVKFCIKCYLCDYPASYYYQYGDIPSFLSCDACEADVSVTPELVRIGFERVKNPEPYQHRGSMFAESENDNFYFREEEYGLRLEA